MKTYSISTMAILLFSFGFNLGCAKSNSESTSGSTGNYKILTVTGPVTSTNTPAGLQKSSTGVVLSGSSSSAGSNAQFAFSDGQQFITMGQFGDSMACVIRTLVNHNLVSGDGNPTYFEMGATSRLKLTATVDPASQIITAYNIYSCKTSGSSTTQDQYIGSSISSSNAVVTFKLNDSDSGIRVKMGISGTVTDGAWNSKNIEQWISFSSGLIHSTITQSDSTLTSDATMSFSGQNILMYSESTLTGNSQSTYSLGEGTARIKVGSASETIVNWDSTLADTATHSSHYTSVSSQAIPAGIPTSSEILSAAQFSGSEIWDCQFSSSPSTMSSGSAEMQTELQSCF